MKCIVEENGDTWHWKRKKKDIPTIAVNDVFCEKRSICSKVSIHHFVRIWTCFKSIIPNFWEQLREHP